MLTFWCLRSGDLWTAKYWSYADTPGGLCLFLMLSFQNSRALSSNRLLWRLDGRRSMYRVEPRTRRIREGHIPEQGGADDAHCEGLCRPEPRTLRQGCGRYSNRARQEELAFLLLVKRWPATTYVFAVQICKLSYLKLYVPGIVVIGMSAYENA